ncbi:hypothetical protein ACIBIZ_10820 [Nonomuraea spiralis]|uniref:hypothetical protein n=1 Tax=Nonomuraea spiralis TaxID=46182 RepID=UPI00378D4040
MLFSDQHTLVITKPDRVAHSVKKLLVFLEDEVRAARHQPAHPDRHLRRHPPPQRAEHR